MESSIQANEIFILMAIGISIMLVLALAFVLFFNRSQKKILQEQMQRQEQALAHQSALLYSHIAAQEEERKRIAKDLHDEVGSKLNAIFLNMHRLRKKELQSGDFQAIISDIGGLINTTIDTTRRISHDLLPPTLEKFGLPTALQELSEWYSKSEQVNVHFETIQNTRKSTKKQTELHLFRIVQELISNSIKHGKATEIGIQIWLTDAAIRLEYQDNGKGFDAKNEATYKGLGLQNIESRLQMMKGKQEIISEEGNGVEYRISINE